MKGSRREPKVVRSTGDGTARSVVSATAGEMLIEE